MVSLEKERSRLQQEIEAWVREGGPPQAGESGGLPSSGSWAGSYRDELNQWLFSWLETLPTETKKRLANMMEHLVIYLSHFFHKNSQCDQVEQEILMEARMFQPELERFEQLPTLDFYRLQYMERKLSSRYPYYALLEGGLSGTGHPLLLAVDFPALLAINLKMVHYIASAYGYSLRYPNEQILVLKVLHAASLPKPHREAAWKWLIGQRNGGETDLELSVWTDSQALIKEEWLETLVKQWLKALVLYGLKRSSKKNGSLLGMIVGASLNYYWTRDVARFASYFYRYRFLEEIV